MTPPGAARALTALAWLQLALCVLPLTLGYAFASFFVGVTLADVHKREVRDFAGVCVLAGAGLALFVYALRLRPLSGGVLTPRVAMSNEVVGWA